MIFFISSTFLDRWQTLIGAALGPFLAVILSAVGFLIKSLLENRSVRKENHRRIEIGVTRSLNDVYTIREQLNQFVERLRGLTSEARIIADENEYFLHTINFPTVREVYRDPEASIFKVKSYYLHNNLLFIDAGAKELNEAVRDLKDYFKSLIQKNEMLVALGDRPQHQRQAYADNLDNFASAINDYTTKHIQSGIKMMARIKVYNGLLRKRWGRLTLWKQESTKYKYFKTKDDQKKFARDIGTLERIDSNIEKMVLEEMAKVDKRREKLLVKR